MVYTLKQNETDPTSTLKQYLDAILKVADKKYKYNNKPDEIRIKWGKLIVQTIKVYGELVKNEELDELRVSIDEIKERLNMNE